MRGRLGAYVPVTLALLLSIACTGAASDGVREVGTDRMEHAHKGHSLWKNAV